MLILIILLILSSVISASVCLAEDLEIEMSQVRYADPESLQSIVRGLLSHEGKVSYDQRTNNLIVIDKQENIKKIKEVIEKIDRRPMQVRIEFIIADISETFAKDIGIGGAHLVVPAGSGAFVSLIESRDDASIHSKSFVTTLSNTPARLQVTKDIFFGAEIIIYTGWDIIAIPAVRPVGSILEVLPIVNEDNTITLYISPSLSTIDKHSGMPFNRALATQIVVNNKETIAIGGLETAEKVSGQGAQIAGTRKIVMFVSAEILH